MTFEAKLLYYTAKNYRPESSMTSCMISCLYQTCQAQNQDLLVGCYIVTAVSNLSEQEYIYKSIMS